jgi:LysM repeat protein
MKWKDGKDAQSQQGDADTDYLEDEAYAPWRKGSGSGTFFDLFKPSYIVATVVIFVLIVIVAALIPKGRSDSSDKMVKEMDGRLKLMESRLAKLESTPSSSVASAKVEDHAQQIDRLRSRLDKLETALAQRVDDLAKQIPRAETRPASPPPPVVKPSAGVPAVKTAPAEKTAAKPRTHQVQSGDTLYSIGRRYGVPVEVLCRLNNIPAAQCNAYQVKLGETLVVGGGAN